MYPEENPVRTRFALEPLLEPLAHPDNVEVLAKLVEYRSMIPHLEEDLCMLLARQLGKPRGAPCEELLDFYRQNARRLRWDGTEGVFVVGETPAPGQLLPSGFIPVTSAGTAEDGYPLRVRCMKDDAEMVYVPPGRYWDSANDGQWVNVGRFYIDRFEVTNERYLRFCRATHRKPPKYERKSMGDSGPLGPPEVTTLSNFDTSALPVTCIRWDDAYAYAKWAGKSLPNEDEWLRAAHGDRKQSFPWGERDNALSKDALDQYAIFGREMPETGGLPMPVGGRDAGASPFGVEDMAGNVQEFLAGRGSHGSYLSIGGSYRNRWPGRINWTSVDVDERLTSWRTEATPWTGFRCVLVLRSGE
jgi:hypothetical protein